MTEASATNANDPPRRVNTLYGAVNDLAGGVVVCDAMWQVVALRDELDTDYVTLALVGVVAIVVTAAAGACLYVLGQVAGALAAGLRVRDVFLLGIHLDLDAGTLRRQPSQPPGHPRHQACATARRPALLRWRVAAKAAAGPLALMLGGALAFVLAWYWQAQSLAVPASPEGVWYQAWARPGTLWVAVCNMLGGFCLYWLVGAVLPRGHRGARNDALQVIDCLRDRPGAFRYLAVAALWDEMAEGTRPRDWNPEWVWLLSGEADGTYQQALADQMAYDHAEDCGRHEEAGRLLDRALDAGVELPPAYRKALHVTAAYHEGFHRGDAQQGKYWLSQVDRSELTATAWMRAEAALLGAEGRYAEALTLLGSALQAAERLPKHGGSVAERDWLERMQHRYRQLQATPGTEAPGQHGIRQVKDQREPDANEQGPDA
jgi:hypothetical protein